MNNKLIYWVPIVGVFVSLVNYDKESGMSVGWAYYQSAMIVIFIWIMAFISYDK